VQSRLDETELVAAVEARALEAIREHGFLREQRFDRVGELDLAARAGLRCFDDSLFAIGDLHLFHDLACR
jgi:hypothetical protein